MKYLKNFLFYTCFYLSTVFLAIISLPLIFFNRKYLLKILVVWANIFSFLLKVIFSISYNIKGNKVKKQVIYAIKHSSIWETIILPYELYGNPSIVMKMELVKIPLIGNLFKHSGAIPINRSKKIDSIKKLIYFAKKAKINGDVIIIYPEGTRNRNSNTNYLPGIYSIYKHTNLPVIPVAHNSGKFWKNKKSI